MYKIARWCYRIWNSCNSTALVRVRWNTCCWWQVNAQKARMMINASSNRNLKFFFHMTTWNQIAPTVWDWAPHVGQGWQKKPLNRNVSLQVSISLYHLVEIYLSRAVGFVLVYPASTIGIAYVVYLTTLPLCCQGVQLFRWYTTEVWNSSCSTYWPIFVARISRITQVYTL